MSLLAIPDVGDATYVSEDIDSELLRLYRAVNGGVSYQDLDPGALFATGAVGAPKIDDSISERYSIITFAGFPTQTPTGNVLLGIVGAGTHLLDSISIMPQIGTAGTVTLWTVGPGGSPAAASLGQWAFTGGNLLGVRSFTSSAPVPPANLLYAVYSTTKPNAVILNLKSMHAT